VASIVKSIARYSTAVLSPTDASHPLELTGLADLLSEPDEVVDWLVDDRVPLGGVVMLVGKPKTGKSTLARDLALQVARGGSWLGFQCLKRSVIYIALEDRRADVRRHFRDMGATGEESMHFVFREGAGDLVTRLRVVAAADRPGLIIVDTLQRAIKARDLNDYAEVTTKLTPILTLARETGAAVLLLHHAGKALREDALDTVLGSTALTGSVDNVLLLCRNDRYRTLRSIQRVGSDLPETVLHLDANGETRADGTRAEADVRRVEFAFVEVLGAGPLERSALLETVEGRHTDKLSALKRLVVAGTLVRSGAGKKQDPHIYTLGSGRNCGSQVPNQCAEPAIEGPRILKFPNDSAPDCGSQSMADLERAGNHKSGGQTADDQIPTPLADGPAGVSWDADEHDEDES
jgi:hypothetical protein